MLYGEYTCQSCSHKKRKVTSLEKYGSENYMGTDVFNEKSIKTIKEKYGDVDNIFQSDIIKEKIKNTLVVKYGVDHISKSEFIKDKIKETNLSKYGVEHYYQSDDFKSKSDETKMNRYGDSNYINVEKCLETRTKNGNMIDRSLLSDWKMYKRLVWKLTQRVKCKLYLEWDGNDYYDQEYIKENLKINDRYHINYPTIDHKISLKYGFENNIIPQIIAGIDNLCITKRYLNSVKNVKTEDEFKSFLQSLQ